MKILIGMTRSDTLVAGAFKHISQIGERFRDEGCEVIYVLGGDGIATKNLRDSGYKVYGLQCLKRELSVFWDFLAFIQLLFVVLKEKPDVCSWHTAKIGALGRIVAALTFRRSFYVPHGVPFANTPENLRYGFYEKLEKMLALLPSTIVGVCNYDRDEYLRIGVDGSKVLVIPNGMNGIVRQKKMSIDDDGHPVKFITAARFEAQKDYATLAAAVRTLVANKLPFSLDIYGDGQLEDQVKGMFKDWSGDSVHFKGVVQDFASELAKADVFLLCSHWEGLPRSIIEAMACAKPIIASRVGGAQELVKDNVNGYLVGHKDSAGFAESMKSYIDNPLLIEQHGGASLVRYKEGYTLERMLSSYVDVYLNSAWAVA